MADMTQAKREWLATALGVGRAEPGDAEGPQGKFSLSDIGGALLEGGQALVHAGQQVGQAVVQTGQQVGHQVQRLIFGPDLAEIRQELAGGIDTLDKSGLKTERLQADRASAEQALEAAGKLTDEAAREKAEAQARQRLNELRQHTEALASALHQVMGDGKGPPTDEQRAKIYGLALKDYYGLEITVPPGMTNTHLDRFFDMMGTVPREQTDHSKLKKLTYKNQTGYGGAYLDGQIWMGDFGDATSNELKTVDGKRVPDYEIDGQPIPANSFDVTTLHEMGHALDDKRGIMAAHGSKTAAGGWKAETLDSCADVMAKAFSDSATGKLDAGVVRAAVATVLGGGTPAAPRGTAPEAWQELQQFLADKVLPSRVDKTPWGSAREAFGGRCYLQSYASRWSSYELAARATTQVNNYQWRAAGEWFAEVYAISWLAKKPPPAGVLPEVAAWMWKA